MNNSKLVDLTLYPTEKGGRESGIKGDWFDCQIWVNEGYRDCRILLNGVSISPGETRRFIVDFLSWDTADLVRDFKTFLLFEDRAIGEGCIVPPEGKTAASA